MFDPLQPPSMAARSAAHNQPGHAWPSSPHRPSDLPDHPSHARSSSASPAPRQQPYPGSPSQHGNGTGPRHEWAKDAVVYNAPAPSLISPEAMSAAQKSSGQPTRLGPFLRVKITGMERNRKDLLIRFDASTNLPNFRTSMYKNMQRSYVEFRLFADQLSIGNPQTIVAALPLPSSSATTDEEDDRLVRIALQRWFSRVCLDPVLLADEEFRSFVESDFGYNPVPRVRRKAPTSSFASLPIPLLRKGAHDDDDALASARYELERLDGRFAEAARAVDKMSKARKTLAAAEGDLGGKLVLVATTEVVPTLGVAMRKLGRAMDAASGIQTSQSVSECVVVGDTLGYQSLNARAAKETLLQRIQIVEEHQAAAKVTITKRRVVERMKGSTSIVPSKVDDAIDELQQANDAELVLAHRLTSISNNLHRSLNVHSRQTHEDLAVALLEHARMNVMYERAVFRELEALKGDVRAIGTAGLPGSTLPPPVVPVDRTGMPPTRTWVEQPKPQRPPLLPTASSSATASQPASPAPVRQQQQISQPHQQTQQPAPLSPPPRQSHQPSTAYFRPPPPPSSSSISGASSSSQQSPLGPGPLYNSSGGGGGLTQSLYAPSASASHASPQQGSRSSFVPPSAVRQSFGGESSSGTFDPLGGGGYSSRGTGSGSVGGEGERMTQSMYLPGGQPVVQQQERAAPAPPARRRLDPKLAASMLGKGF